MAIEQGRIKFEVPKKPMKIGDHPFPTNMVDAGGKKNAFQAKQLTSQSVEDPNDQVLTDQESKSRPDDEGSKKLKKKVSWVDLADEAEGSQLPRRQVTSPMLLNKWHSAPI